MTHRSLHYWSHQVRFVQRVKWTCGLLGSRVGEAQNPGPDMPSPSHEMASGDLSLFCINVGVHLVPGVYMKKNLLERICWLRKKST